MKKKTLNLSFNKETISKLQMKEAKGGMTFAGCQETFICPTEHCISQECVVITKGCQPDTFECTQEDGCISWISERPTCFNCITM